MKANLKLITFYRLGLLLISGLGLWVHPHSATAAHPPPQAPTKPPDARIYLAVGAFDPLVDPEPLHRQRNSDNEDTTLYLLQFNGPIQHTWKTTAENLGARLYTYVPNYAFIARLDSGAEEELLALPYVRWIGPYHTAYRVAPALATAQSSASVPYTVTVQALPDTDLALLNHRITALGGTLLGHATRMTSQVLRVVLPSDRVAELASLDNVVWIEPYIAPQLLNDVAGGDLMRAEDLRTDLGLYGEGQIVAVADTGLDVGTLGSAMSDDFEGRIVEGQAMCTPLGLRDTWNDFHGHGTHVAGSVLGSGQNSGSTPTTHQYTGSFAGVAPEAQLVFQAIDDPSSDDLECVPDNFVDDLFQPAYALGARIHSNSWGGPTGGTDESPEYGGYTNDAQMVDEAAWEHKDLLILYGAGNSGTDADADGRVDVDSIVSPSTAKNVLTVGATESLRESATTFTWGMGWPDHFSTDPIAGDHIANHADGMAAFSSRGPTDDGRIKPDVVAPGTMIISARSHDPQAGSGWGAYNEHYVYNGGTSMATPLTAGGAALIREALIKQHSLTNPSSALIKALLINGAKDISPGQYTTTQEIPAQRPNAVSGWGRVDLVNTLTPLSQTLWFTDNTTGLATGETEIYTLTVKNGTALHVVLVWTDYPGSPTAARALVNDLDLSIIGPDDTPYPGNIGVYSAGSQCLRDAQWDQCNNVEGVIIPDAATGTYRVRVHAHNVAQGPQQPFALVAAGNITFQNTPPTLESLPNLTVHTDAGNYRALDLWAYAEDVQDPDSALTFSIVNSPPVSAGITLDPETHHHINITPTQRFTGTFDVAVQVEDTGGLTDTATFQVHITDKNLPPVLSLPEVITLTVNTSATLNLWEYVTDLNHPDAVLTFALLDNDQTTLVITGAAIIEGHLLTLRPPTNYVGHMHLEIFTYDPEGLSTSDRLTVVVERGTSYIYLPLVLKCYPLVPILHPIDNPDDDGIYDVTWDPPAGSIAPSSYEYQVATNSVFSPTQSTMQTQQTSIGIYTRTPNTYYWRVRANLDGLWSIWSNVESVTVGDFTYLFVINDTGGSLTIEVVDVETHTFADQFDGYWRSAPRRTYTYNVTARCGTDSGTLDAKREYIFAYQCVPVNSQASKLRLQKVTAP